MNRAELCIALDRLAYAAEYSRESVSFPREVWYEFCQEMGYIPPLEPMFTGEWDAQRAALPPIRRARLEVQQ